MAVTAMLVSEENLEFVSRFESSQMKENLAWLRSLLDLSAAQGVNYYIVSTYVFNESMFIRDSMIILREDHFHAKYAFVEEGKPGFSQAVSRDDL